MNNKYKKRIWRDNRSKKILKRITRKNKHKRKGTSYCRSNQSLLGLNEIEFRPPLNFSIVQNTEETMCFFGSLCEKIYEKKLNQNIFINSKNVENVTIDALVYLIAIIHNIKLVKILKYQFRGNLPEIADAKLVYKESGFLNFFNTKIPRELKEIENKIQITSGDNADTMMAKQICDFVNDKFKTNKTYTSDLYRILIELMANVQHHAYIEGESSTMQPLWYLFAEYNNDASIRFVFIDTGEGIPSTVRKKILEKFNNKVKDSDLMLSAFCGEDRSRTRLTNRGHGLPALYDSIRQSRIVDFAVVSGSGKCYSSGVTERTINQEEYTKKIYGTIFSFDINKRGDV